MKPFTNLLMALYSLYLIYASLGIMWFGGLINTETIEGFDEDIVDESWVYLNLVHVNNAWLHHLLVSILNSWLHILLPLLLSRIHDLLMICSCLSHIWIERQGDSLVDLRHPSNWSINLLPGYYGSRWSIYPDW